MKFMRFMIGIAILIIMHCCGHQIYNKTESDDEKFCIAYWTGVISALISFIINAI